MKAIEFILNVTSWIAVVIGFISLLGGLQRQDNYAVIGGSLFFVQGLVALMYIWGQNR